MKVGDLIEYGPLSDADPSRFALGLCLREERNPSEGTDGPMRMLVMWFDDQQSTHEPLDSCQDREYYRMVSESR